MVSWTLCEKEHQPWTNNARTSTAHQRTSTANQNEVRMPGEYTVRPISDKRRDVCGLAEWARDR